jgi:hypothetical protein
LLAPVVKSCTFLIASQIFWAVENDSTTVFASSRLCVVAGKA